MALPKEIEILWSEREILKHLTASDKTEIAKWFNVLRSWGKYNMLTTNLTPYFTDGKNVLRQELAAEILNAMDEEGEDFDYETFLEERYPQVKYIHDNSQKMRDIMTKLTMLYMQENGEEMSTGNVNKHFDTLTRRAYTTIMRSPYFDKEVNNRENINEQFGLDDNLSYTQDSDEYANKFVDRTGDAYFDEYVKPEYKEAIFKQWDKLGKADYSVLKLFNISDEDVDEDFTDFRNIGDIVYPLLYLEWVGGVHNTKFAKMDWVSTNEAGWEKIKFKVQPVDYDYLYDESENFGEHGYACWDIRVIIDKNSDLTLPVNEKFIDNDYLPYIQELFPESSRDKLSSFRNYSQDQIEVIEMIWDFYVDNVDFTPTFCQVEVVLV